MSRHEEFDEFGDASQMRAEDIAPTIWVGDVGTGRLDCETAVLLRSHVRPDFDRAGDWKELQIRLQRKGFDLVFEEGVLILRDSHSGVAICTGRFLGFSLQRLVQRFGRPKVIALNAGHLGELLH